MLRTLKKIVLHAIGRFTTSLLRNMERMGPSEGQLTHRNNLQLGDLGGSLSGCMLWPVFAGEIIGRWSTSTG